MTKESIPDRKDILDDHKWDLTPLFKNHEDWEVLFGEVEKEFESYTNFKGRLKDSLLVFKNAIKFHLMIIRKIEKLYTY